MLTIAFERLRQQPWAQGLALLLAAALTLAAAALAVQGLAERQLEAEAERAALAVSLHLAGALPEVELVFLGEAASPLAQQRLAALRGMPGLLRFTLFDPQGRALLDSAAPGETARADAVDPARQRAARRSAQTGSVNTELGRSDGNAAVHSRSWVPVRQDGATLGVAEIVLDQSAAAAATSAAYQRAAAAAALALLLGLAGAALLLRGRGHPVSHAIERAAFLTEHDTVTGALNHGPFTRRLEHACSTARGDGALALICIDLDAFGDINDRHGRAVGDELLRRTCLRLQAALRGADLLARLAGDRFAVLLPGAGDAAAVTALVQRMVARLAEPHELPGLAQAVHASASIGAALLGVDGSDAGTLLHHAETAMLRAKSRGRGAWSFYEASLEQRLQEQRCLSHELQQAVAGGGLRLHFQPLYGADGATLVGYEALARWPHVRRGFVPPDEFIPLAEADGQIEALGRWVLHAACTEAALWPAPLSVAVNLSPAQFRRGDDIVDEVAAALASSGLPAQRLELEITESLLLSHTEQVLGTLQALRRLGVRIAMDDFGTGYSSLAYLWRFPFDRLKIDRSFTQRLGQDPRVDVIVRSIVSLAHSLAMRVTGEGVETDQQRLALSRHGCDELQGYLLGRPAPSERLVHLEAETAAMLLTD